VFVGFGFGSFLCVLGFPWVGSVCFGLFGSTVFLVLALIGCFLLCIICVLRGSLCFL
jgi:hypothetical protein